MNRITEIRPVSKTKYKIYINEQFAFILYKGELLHYDLTENADISDETIEEIYSEVLYKRAKLQANKLLAQMDKTEHQLRDNLRKHEYPDLIIDRVIELCSSMRLIDDRRYAENYVYTYQKSKSIRMIKYELMQRGLTERIIEDAVSSVDPDSEYDGICKYLERKWPEAEELSYEDRQKIMAFLQRKGFGYESIRSAMRRYVDEKHSG